MSEFTVSLEEIAEAVDDLPVFPQRTLAIVKMLEAENMHVIKIAEFIQRDFSLTMRLIKLANSAYYAQQREIVTVLEALVLLGLKTVKELVLAGTAYRFLSPKVKGYLLQGGALFNHSFCCAVASKEIALKASLNAEQAYMAGLLHDVGKLILACHVETAFERIIEKCEQKHCSFDQVEQEILGFSHSQIGAEVMRRWRFPEEIVIAIGYHHTPLHKQANLYSSVVHIADGASLMLGVGLGADGLAYTLEEDAFKKLGLSPDIIEEIVAVAAEAQTHA